MRSVCAAGALVALVLFPLLSGAVCTPQNTLVDPSAAPARNKYGQTFDEYAAEVDTVTELPAILDYSDTANNDTDAFVEACTAAWEGWQCPQYFAKAGFGEVLPSCISNCLTFARVCAGFDDFTSKLSCLAGRNTTEDPAICPPDQSGQPGFFPLTERANYDQWLTGYSRAQTTLAPQNTTQGSTLTGFLYSIPWTLWLALAQNGNLDQALKLASVVKSNSPTDALSAKFGKAVSSGASAKNKLPGGKAGALIAKPKPQAQPVSVDATDTMMTELVRTGVTCTYFSCLNLLWLIGGIGAFVLLIVFIIAYNVSRDATRRLLRPVDILKDKHRPQQLNRGSTSASLAVGGVRGSSASLKGRVEGDKWIPDSAPPSRPGSQNLVGAGASPSKKSVDKGDDDLAALDVDIDVEAVAAAADVVRKRRTSFGGIVSIAAIMFIVALGVWMFVVFFVLNSNTTYGFLTSGQTTNLVDSTLTVSLFVNYSFYYVAGEAGTSLAGGAQGFKFTTHFEPLSGATTYDSVPADVVLSIYGTGKAIPVVNGTVEPTVNSTYYDYGNYTGNYNDTGSYGYGTGSYGDYGGSGSGAYARHRRASSSSSSTSSSNTTTAASTGIASFYGPALDVDGTPYVLVWGLVPIFFTYGIVDTITLTFLLPNSASLKNASVTLFTSFTALEWYHGPSASGTIGTPLDELNFIDLIQTLSASNTPQTSQSEYGATLNISPNSTSFPADGGLDNVQFTLRTLGSGALLNIQQIPVYTSNTAFSFFMTVASAIMAGAAFIMVSLEDFRSTAEKARQAGSLREALRLFGGFLFSAATAAGAAVGGDEDGKKEDEEEESEKLKEAPEVKEAKEAAKETRKAAQEGGAANKEEAKQRAQVLLTASRKESKRAAELLALGAEVAQVEEEQGGDGLKKKRASVLLSAAEATAKRASILMQLSNEAAQQAAAAPATPAAEPKNKLQDHFTPPPGAKAEHKAEHKDEHKAEHRASGIEMQSFKNDMENTE